LALLGKSVVDAGGVIIEILETRSFGPVTKADLDTWIKTYKIPNTTVMDPPGTGTKTYTTWGQREQTWIVDCKTMKILKHISGSVAGIGDSSVKQGIAFMMPLLGK